MANTSSLQEPATVSKGQSYNGSIIQIMNGNMVQLLSQVVVNISVMMELGLFRNAFTTHSKNVVLSTYDLLTCLITIH